MIEFRSAVFSDIPEIIELGRQALAESRYADAGINEAAAQQILTGLIAKQGEAQAFAALVLLAVKDGAIIGMIIGHISPVYLVLSVNVLTDLLWYVQPGTHARVTPHFGTSR